MIGSALGMTKLKHYIFLVTVDWVRSHTTGEGGLAIVLETILNMNMNVNTIGLCDD